VGVPHKESVGDGIAPISVGKRGELARRATSSGSSVRHNSVGAKDFSESKGER
jgi:hypothetical protein